MALCRPTWWFNRQLIERERVSSISLKYIMSFLIVTGGLTFSTSAQKRGTKPPVKVDTLKLNDDDDNLVTGSVMREGKMLSYCINISDAATETRNSILLKNLNTVEARIDKKLEILAIQMEELKSWTMRREKFLKTGNESIVNIFQSMRADAAALQLTELGPVLAASIILKLEPKKSSAILTEMKPADAAKVATVLTSAVEADESK